jgi:putative transposase
VHSTAQTNGYCESFNGKLRDELLDREIFYTLLEAKVLIERWRIHYNTQRPHSALGYRPPAPEAVTWPPIAPAGDLLGAPSQTPPGALPLDPGFFPLTRRPESKLVANRLTSEVVS